MITQNPTDAVRWTVSELASEVGVASSTVVRTCQALGFRGYQELKVLLAQDLQRGGVDNVDENISSKSEPSAILRAVVQRGRNALDDVTSTISNEEFGRAVVTLSAADTVLVTGFGMSSAPAHDISHRLVTVGRRAVMHNDPILQHSAASQLNAGDVCLAISHTGTTRETIVTTAAARAAGAPVITLTSFAHCPLTELSDVRLVAGAPEWMLNMQAISSRLAHLAVLDALYLGMSLADSDRTSVALDRMTAVAGEHHW